MRHVTRPNLPRLRVVEEETEVRWTENIFSKIKEENLPKIVMEVLVK